MFLERFLLSNIFLAVFICILLALKWLFRNHLSMRAQYHSWYVLLISIFFPLLPNKFWNIWDFVKATPQQAFGLNNTISTISNILPIHTTQMTDTTELIHPYTSPLLSYVVCVIWIMGVVVLMGMYGYGWYRLHKIRYYAICPTIRVQSIWMRCCQRLQIKANVELKQSKSICTPMSFGIYHHCVVLPSNDMETISEKELEHILIHELVHIQHEDLHTNYILCAVQALLWFHPLIWIAFRQLRCDREAYCDWGVMNLLHCEKERIQYGQTILHFAAKHSAAFHIATGFCQNQEQLKYRIQKIVDFQCDSRLRTWSGRFFTCVLAVISIAQMPISVYCANVADDNYTPPKTITIEEMNCQDILHDLDGCAVIYDFNKDLYYAYHPSEITHRFPPCSTYKIYSALNALEQGVISPAQNTLAWNHTVYDFAEWNHDHNLQSAMHSSVNWYFHALDDAVGTEQLESFYQEIGYGNGIIGKNMENYANGASLQISPLEQVMLLEKLYHNDFGFDEANIQAIQYALLSESNNGVPIYGKTGTGNIDGKNVAGWYIGYVETAENTYFFATYLHSENGIDGPQVQEITKNILSQLDMI